MGPAVVTMQRHDSPAGGWEMARRTPPAVLRPYVARYTGYREWTAAPLRRREAATPLVPLVLSFGAPVRVLDPSAPGRPPATRVSFAAGLDAAPALVEHDGDQHGIQVDLPPLAAGMLLGVPAGELAGAAVPLDDLLGAAATEWAERLRAAPGWEARFRLLDALVAGRLADAAEPPAGVAAAWEAIARSGGRIAIEALAADLGWSRRHLAARFREHVGLPPKVVARIVRFRRARALLERGGRPAEVAFTCGYADQAHLNRDFRALAGVTPTELLAMRLPDGGGVAGAEVPFVQDGAAAAA